jgi:lipoprotein-anchoring transpeptidase ErfK/SrfK
MNRLICSLLVATCCFTFTGTAVADLRSDARALLAKLRQERNANRFPDELRNLDATLATAEMYYQLSDLKNADRYYLFAIQKGSLLEKRLLPPRPDASLVSIQLPPPSPTVPASVQPAPATKPVPAVVSEEEPEYSSNRLIGTNGTYTVVKGDTIRLVAAKLGVSRNRLTTMNGLDAKAGLKIGQELHYNNRRIVPQHRIKDGIVINIPDRTLYFFQQGQMIFSTAVALGTPTKTDQLVWETPIGRFKIVNKAKDPTWTVPPSIQEEMRLQGKEIITSIPPGKDNPLGKFALKTSLPGILIHSTTRPWSIYTYSSHGCIRVYPERMEELFKLVKLQTAGEIIYRPIKLVVTDEGHILLEAHGDIYNKTKGLTAEAQTLIRSHKLDDQVDWEKVKRVISRKAGVAEEITRRGHAAQQTSSNNRSQSPS